MLGTLYDSEIGRVGQVPCSELNIVGNVVASGAKCNFVLETGQTGHI